MVYRSVSLQTFYAPEVRFGITNDASRDCVGHPNGRTNGVDCICMAQFLRVANWQNRERSLNVQPDKSKVQFGMRSENNSFHRAFSITLWKHANTHSP